jgi:transcriptional regulator with XRE-family HTH domain
MDETTPASLPDALARYKTSAIAETLGVSAQAVSAWKTDKGFPSADRFERLAEFLGVSVAQIVRWATNRKAVA